MTYQLRIYDIQEGALPGFTEEWRKQIVPLRKQYGFEIVGAWMVGDANQFVWILGHDDFEAADHAYYDSPQRAAMDPDPRRLIQEADTRLMTTIAEAGGL
jgi:hypothetical protein